MSKIFVGDIGTEIVVDCGEAITGATSLKLRVKKPNGSLVEWIGSIKTNTSFKYIVQSGDFSIPGVYIMQAHVTLPDWEGSGEIVEIIVFDRISI